MYDQQTDADIHTILDECTAIHVTNQKYIYRKTTSERHNKSQNLNVSHLVLQLSLPNPLKPDVKSRMKM